MNSIGVDFKLKNIISNNKKVKLQIWDTAGQERFKTITTSYYKGAQAIVIVYDVTDQDSFDHLKNWMSDIDKFAKEGIMKILVGNKVDLTEKRVISTEQGKDFARKYGIEYIETSAKVANNIDELFQSAAKTFIINQSLNPLKKSNANFSANEGIVIPVSNQTAKKKKGCCK